MIVQKLLSLCGGLSNVGNVSFMLLRAGKYIQFLSKMPTTLSVRPIGSRGDNPVKTPTSGGFIQTELSKDGVKIVK